ncbi:hypothetical protein G6F24_008885 [Rhizopus arrhizus]|nr:hypothetical protein G6F24_008885 [Rhizopus arrhizus]
MFWTLFAILGLAASVFLGNIQDWRDTETQGEIAAIAGSMQVYRGAVAAYQASNPAASGTVADTQLGLPTWYVKAPGISNVIQAGKVYVFYSQPKPGLAEALLKRTDNALTVGIKQSGNLVNPRRGVVASLPSAIPDGTRAATQWEAAIRAAMQTELDVRYAPPRSRTTTSSARSAGQHHHIYPTPAHPDPYRPPVPQERTLRRLGCNRRFREPGAVRGAAQRAGVATRTVCRPGDGEIASRPPQPDARGVQGPAGTEGSIRRCDVVTECPSCREIESEAGATGDAGVPAMDQLDRPGCPEEGPGRAYHGHG